VSRADDVAARLLSDRRFQALVADGRRAWPDVEVSPRQFARYLAERAAAEDEIDALFAAQRTDLYLACACAANDPRALSLFDRAFLSDVARHVAPISASPAFADEVRQLLREKLFVPTRGRPKILDYTGRGPLGGWVRVAAVRTARNLARSSRTPGHRARGDEPILAARPDPELLYLKRQYAEEFRAAFEKTLSELSARERTILRLHFLDAMSSTEIAALYRVSGATIRNWIKQSREAILAETRRRLGMRLKADSRELDGVMGLIDSHFDLTVSRLLR
jgi:RNA polymerase sigma-70 factor (ECF subfamily)